jgi:NAD+-dependent protein deacetylase sirtuin 4
VPLQPGGARNEIVERSQPAVPAIRDRARLFELCAGRRIVALVGAGLSTDSGIPDYRGAGRAPRTPIQHREFCRSERARARYWARSVIGWAHLGSAVPNDGHRALARLEHAGCVRGVITQNVDGLHHQAGSVRVVELHGALRRVRCLACGNLESRTALQERMRALNAGFDLQPVTLAPDGDADLADERLASFVTPSCVACDGVLKPDVVFFGDNVPPDVLAQAWALFEEAEVLLVLGSSLAVWSGFRFVKKAAERGMPVAIVNLGPTRGDPLATVRLDEPLGTLLPALAAALDPVPPRP